MNRSCQYNIRHGAVLGGRQRALDQLAVSRLPASSPYQYPGEPGAAACW